MSAERTARTVDVVVVGAGPAGLTAGIELVRAGAGTVEVVDRERAAGGVPRHCAHTGFGLRDLHRLLDGPDYARRLVDAAVAAGATVRVGVSVTGWDARGGLMTTSPAGLETLSARAVVLATGARERPRSARLVAGARVAGVYTTGQLQQAVYLEHQTVGRRAVVVGAEHVSFSAVVTLQHAGVDVVAMTTELPRQQSYLAFRAGVAVRYRVPVRTRARVVRILGRSRVEAVELAYDGGTREVLACDTLVFTGDWVADNELSRMRGVTVDAATTGPSVDTGLRTSVAGVYAVGNLVHPVLSADAAALDGRRVAETVLADLHGAARTPSEVAVSVEPPLRWIAPQRITDPAALPARGRFVLWAAEFRSSPRLSAPRLSAPRLSAPTVVVWQGDRLLASLRPMRQLVPGRPFEISSDWLARVDPAGPDVVVSLQQSRRAYQA